MSQNRNDDYDLENASGRVFREELNKLLADIKSMNSASGVPPTPIEGQLFYDTDDDIVYIFDGTNFVALWEASTQNWVGGLPNNTVNNAAMASSSIGSDEIIDNSITFGEIDSTTAGNARGKRSVIQSTTRPSGGSIGDIVYQYD